MTLPETPTPLRINPKLEEDLRKFELEVERLRAEYGDPYEALSQWVHDHFDPEDFANWENHEDDDWMNGR